MKAIIEQYYREIVIVILVIVIIVLAILFLNKEKHIVESSVEEISYVENNEKEPEEVNTKIKVDIKGAVAKPGVYELEAKSVVNDVIKLAGGLKKTADTSNINLSKELESEMVIKVFTANEIKKIAKEKELAPTADNTCTENTIIIDKCSESPIIKDTDVPDNTINDNSSNESNTNINKDASTPSKLISINTATIDELLTLPGIGESKAQNIIKYREENGLFKTTEDIINVSGIGEAAYNKIKDNITV